jgi:hypothetical protein
MPTADRNDLMPAQEKLEWVTPKISLMETGETLGNNKYNNGCAEGVALMGGQCNVQWPTAGGPS